MAGLFFNRVTIPVGMLLLLLVLVALIFMPPIPLDTIDATSSSVALQEVTSIEVAFISSHIPGEYQEYKDGDGPEGSVPQPPQLSGPVKIYILNQAAQKVIELRDKAGNVIAKTTWTLSDMIGFYDDWTGPNPVWSSKVEVLKDYGGNGLGVWLWKFSDRFFYQPGMTRLFFDMSKTSSGQTGWTTFNLPTVLGFIQQNVSSFNVLLNDPALKILVIQYP